VIAPGKIEAFEHAKIIQIFESGKIAAIHVEPGQLVKTGDVLVELDRTEALADQQSAQDELFASLAEQRRRRFAIESLSPIQSVLASATAEDPAPSLEAIIATAKTKIAWEPELPETIRLRELSVLDADINQLASQLQNLDKAQAGKIATRQRLHMSIDFQNELINTLNKRVGVRESSLAREVGTKIGLYDAQEELQKSQSVLASDQGELIETDAALRELTSEKVKDVSQFVADSENKLAAAAKKGDEARQALNKAEARLRRTSLTAPVDGVVQKLAATTIGQVFTTGQRLMVISPSISHLQGIPTPSTALSARRVRGSLRADPRQRGMWMCPQIRSWTQMAGGGPTSGGRRR